MKHNANSQSDTSSGRNCPEICIRLFSSSTSNSTAQPCRAICAANLKPTAPHRCNCRISKWWQYSTTQLLLRHRVQPQWTGSAFDNERSKNFVSTRATRQLPQQQSVPVSDLRLLPEGLGTLRVNQHVGSQLGRAAEHFRIPAQRYDSRRTGSFGSCHPAL